MARKRTKLYSLFRRGNGVYIWWADGKGDKIRVRVTDRHGNKVTTDLPEIEQQRYAADTFNRWSHAPEETVQKGQRRQGPITLGQLTALFVDSQGESWDELTILAYIKIIDRLQNHFGPSTPVIEISHIKALSFIKHIRAEGRFKQATDEKHLGLYKRLFWYARENLYTPLNPFITIRSIRDKESKKNIDSFTPTEITQLVFAAWKVLPWFAPVVMIGAVTGAHQDELANIRVGDVHLEQEKPYFEFRNAISKQYRGRSFGITDSLLPLVSQLVEGRKASDFLFVKPYNRPLIRNDFNQAIEASKTKRAWRKVLDAANIRPRPFNCLRQSVDTNLTSRANVRSGEAAKYVGHSNQVSRRHYQGRPLDITFEHMDTICDMYGITSFAEQAENEPHEETQAEDLCQGDETLDMVE